jgi:ABC-2 type transport system permease protein
MATTTPSTPTPIAPSAALSAGRGYLGVRGRRNRLALALTAFYAILRRDIVVTSRDLIAFLLQVLMQPLFFLFIFGTVLPGIGLAANGFGALLLPGIVALTTLLAAMQGVSLPLVLDLGYAREIDDRLLAPLPVSWVAVEKVLIAALRGMVAGAVIFPLAIWILGDQFNMRTDRILLLVGMIALTAFAGAAFGLLMGTLIRPEQIGLLFSLILTPLLFTGCTYYPWGALKNIQWFQTLTLFNPLTYAAEGMRYAMVPAVNGRALDTLDMRWVVLALAATIVVFFLLGTRTFRRRVIS